MKPWVHTQLQIATQKNQRTCYYKLTLTTCTVRGAKFHLFWQEDTDRNNKKNCMSRWNKNS